MISNLYFLPFNKDVVAGAGCLPTQPSVKVKPGNLYEVQNNRSKEVLTIFCWPGEERAILSFWKTATVI